MFKPNYTISDQTALYLTEIAEARTIILNAPLIPKWEIELRRQALLSSTYASTSIEGNRLSLEQVSDLMIGREITASAKDKQEVLNYFEALNALDELRDKKDITESDILQLHKTVTKGTLPDPSDVGHYRTPKKEAERGQVVVAERVGGVTRRITYIPPKAKLIPDEMKQFIEWFNSKDNQNINPVLHAGVVHYEVARIHPFIDGNGRTARVLATLTLLRRGFETKRYFTLDDFYNSDRTSYYEALKTVQQNIRDLSYWLEYFSKGVAVSINAVKDKVMDLAEGKIKEPSQKQVELDFRQIKIVEFLQKESKITNRQARELLTISNKTAYQVLESLAEHNVIKRIGQGRSVYYALGND